MKTAVSLLAAIAFTVTSFGAAAAPFAHFANDTSMTRADGLQIDAKAKKGSKKKSAKKKKAAATK